MSFYVRKVVNCFLGTDERVHFKGTIMHSANTKLQVEDLINLFKTFWEKRIFVSLSDHLCFYQQQKR